MILMPEQYRQKKAFLSQYDTLAMYKEYETLEEMEQGINATLQVAINDKDITLEAFIELVRFAYSD